MAKKDPELDKHIKDIAKKANEIKKHLNDDNVETSTKDLHILIEDADNKIKEYRRQSYASEKNKADYETLLNIKKGKNLEKATKYANQLADDAEKKELINFREVFKILGTGHDDVYAELVKYVRSATGDKNAGLSK